MFASFYWSSKNACLVTFGIFLVFESFKVFVLLSELKLFGLINFWKRFLFPLIITISRYFHSSYPHLWRRNWYCFAFHYTSQSHILIMIRRYVRNFHLFHSFTRNCDFIFYFIGCCCMCGSLFRFIIIILDLWLCIHLKNSNYLILWWHYFDYYSRGWL